MSDTARAQFPALGSTALVAVTNPLRLASAAALVEQTIASYDLACSRFRADSELTSLNDAAGHSVRVGPILLDAVSAALRAARLTDGDVDPTIGEALIALGYDRDFASVARDTTRAPPSRSSVSIRSVPGWQTVQIDRRLSTIKLPAGVRLDLGATAKALAADEAAATAYASTDCGVLVSLGGDISIAGPPPAEGWRVRVTDDHRSDGSEPGQWIVIRSGGLASSSTTVRVWSGGDGPAHHLVDPRTGWPATVVWRTASVAARSCLDANIASTAAIVRGLHAVTWLKALELPSRLVSLGGVVRHLAGWPPDGDDLA